MTMLPDPVTGYLQDARATGNIPQSNAFDSVKKSKLIQLAQDYIDKYHNFPPLSDITKSLGISIRTFHHHIANDPKFKSDYREVESHLQSHFAQSLGEKALKPQGTLAALAALRFLESHAWNPAGLNPAASNAPSKELIQSFEDAIDAEIVPETSAKPGQLENNTPPENHLNSETH